MTAQMLLFLASLPLMLCLVIFAVWFYGDFNQVQDQSSMVENASIPRILRSQRSYINIEKLQFNLESVVAVSSIAKAREAYITASAILSETVFDMEEDNLTVRKLERDLNYVWHARMENEKFRSALAVEWIEVVHATREAAKALGIDFKLSLDEGRAISSVLLNSNLKQEVRFDIFTEMTGLCRNNKEEYCATFMHRQEDFFNTLHKYQNNMASMLSRYDAIGVNLDAIKSHMMRNELDVIGSEMDFIQRTVDQLKPGIFWLLGSMAGILIFICLVFQHLLVKPLKQVAYAISSFNDASAGSCTVILGPRPTSCIHEINAILQLLTELFTNVNEQSENSRLLTKQNDELKNISLIDSLTGIPNRRSYDLYRQQNKNLPENYVIYMIDIDYFKKLNDTMGHQEGDNVLKKVATILKNQIRSNDLLYRYGGEEFCLIAPNMDEQGSRLLGQRLCAKISAACIINEGTQGFVSISVGYSNIATAEHGDFAFLMSQADQALYYAKGNGRNRAQSYRDLVTKS